MMKNSNTVIKLLLLAMIATVIIFTTYMPPQSQYVSQISDIPIRPTSTKIQLSILNKTKIVLLTYPQLWGFRFTMGRLGFINAGCEVTNCLLTTNHSYVKDYNFDAFLVHTPTQRKGPWILPNRRPDQIFIMFSTEPPDHMPRLDPFEDYFNWTMTYLPESDIPLPYGRIEPLSGAPNTEIERLGIQEHIRLSSVNPAKGKTKLAIWMVSNCHARSNRMQYVRNLQKYVDVDIISNEGKCGGQDLCPKKRKGATCYDIIEKTYKFYLAFENSICRDYVTEKFFDSIGRNLVPIVLGGANYSMIAPKHSYINALDYSPRQLAEYLKEIDQDDSLYAEFFWWKPFYRVVNLHQTNKESFCNLCAALHETPAEKRVAKGLQKWYFEGSHCLVKPKFDST
ncbi:hypothetical protein OUZ56_013382 [Daphnia magna]|uniref:Fucosyltransferase n=1 Tax=Daphnia magna TaxID=35525 RepID=A0ABQ9Z5Q1_9CRUS|nr:hypothetical protein OUZ56_013382 [Daphnia magna]